MLRKVPAVVLLSLSGFFPLFAPARGATPPPLAEFTRLDLVDGRSLRNVVVKSYDSTTDKLTLVADRNLMTVPLVLIPAPFRASIRQAVMSTRSVPAPAVPPKSQGPRSRNPVEPARNDVPTPGTVDTADRELIDAHRSAASAYAEHYYRTEHQWSTGNVSVTVVKIDTADPEPVAGWVGRYRTEGSVEVDVTSGLAPAKRMRATFDVLTEKKPSGAIEVVHFFRKS